MVTWHPDRPLTREELVPHVEGKGSHVIDYAPPTSEPYGDIRTAANRSTTTRWTGSCTALEDVLRHPGLRRAGPGDPGEPGLDRRRAREHLGTSDSAIIKVRRRLIDAARALREQGTPPPGQDPGSFLVRSASVVVPPGADWVPAATPRIVVRPGQSLQLV